MLLVLEDEVVELFVGKRGVPVEVGLPHDLVDVLLSDRLEEVEYVDQLVPRNVAALVLHTQITVGKPYIVEKFEGPMHLVLVNEDSLVHGGHAELRIADLFVAMA